MSVSVFLGLGSNVDREQNISHALDRLLQYFGQLSVSSVYESEAVGFSGAPFLNLVVAVTTELSVAEIMEELRSIENDCGRRRDVPRFSDRTLDIDLLLYGDTVGEVDGVTLPREDITRYGFVLRPLAEVAGERVHPSINACYADLWSRFEAESEGLKPFSFLWRNTDLSAETGATRF